MGKWYPPPSHRWGIPPLAVDNSGSEPDIDYALKIARDSNLDNDASVISLIRTRENKANPIMSRTLELAISEETERVIDIVANLKIPAYISLDTHFKETVNTRMEYVLTVKISF